MSTENKSQPALIQRLIALDENIRNMRSHLHQALVELDTNAVAVQRGIAEIQMFWNNRATGTAPGLSESAMKNVDTADTPVSDVYKAEDVQPVEKHQLEKYSEDPKAWADAVVESVNAVTAALADQGIAESFLKRVAEYYGGFFLTEQEISTGKINAIINAVLVESLTTERLNSPEMFSRVVKTYGQLVGGNDQLLRLPPSLYSFCNQLNNPGVEYDGVVETLWAQLTGYTGSLGPVRLDDAINCVKSDSVSGTLKGLAESYIASVLEGVIRQQAIFPASEYRRRRVKEQLIAEGYALFEKNKGWRSVVNDYDDEDAPLSAMDVAYRAFEMLGGEKGIDPAVLEVTIKLFLCVTATRTVLPEPGQFFKTFEDLLDAREETLVNDHDRKISSKDARAIGRYFGELDHETITPLLEDMAKLNATPQLAARVTGDQEVDITKLVDVIYELIVLTYMDSPPAQPTPGVSEGVIKKLAEFKQVADAKAIEIADHKAEAVDVSEYLDNQEYVRQQAAELVKEHEALEVEEKEDAPLEADKETDPLTPVAQVEAAPVTEPIRADVPMLTYFARFYEATLGLTDYSEADVWQQRVAKAVQWNDKEDMEEALKVLDMTVPETEADLDVYSNMVGSLTVLKNHMQSQRLYDDLRLAYRSIGLTEGEIGTPQDQVGTAADSFISGKQGRDLVAKLLKGPSMDDGLDFLASDGRSVKDQVKDNQEGRQEQNVQEWAVKFRSMASELIRGMFTSGVTENGDGLLEPQAYRQKLYRHDLTTIPPGQWTEYPQGFYGLPDAAHRSYLYKQGTAFNALFILSPMADLKLYDPATGNHIEPATYHEFNMTKMEAFFDSLKTRLEKLTEQ